MGDVSSTASQQYMHGEVKVADSHPVEDCLKPTQPCIELLTSLGTSKSDKYKQLSSMITYLSIEGPLVVRPPLLVFINHYAAPFRGAGLHQVRQR